MGWWTDSLRAFTNLRATEDPRRTGRDIDRHMGRDETGGVHMSPDEALRLSAVWACVTVIAKSIASCEWDVFLEDNTGNRESMKSTMAWRLLNLRPNEEMIPFAFREAALIVALIWGNFFAEIERDGLGRAVALWPLSPDRCVLERHPTTGRLELNVRNAGGAETWLPYKDVFHLHGPSIDGICGLETVSQAARALGMAAAAERFGSAFFANGASVGGILRSQAKVGDEALKDMRAQVEARHKGPSKAFNFMVLGGGVEWQKITIDPEQAQLVETRHLLVEEVCRWFGVPPHKVAHLLHATFSNIEHQGIEFVRDAITPWCERLRQEADWKLIPGSGRFLRTRLDTDWLADGDAKSRAETDSVLVTAGILKRNEARRKRGLNSLGPEGEVPTVNPGTTALPVALQTNGVRPVPPNPEDPPAAPPA